MSHPGSYSSSAAWLVWASRMFFKIFGIVYALVAVLGFMKGNGLVLGMISNNTADTWLHVVLAVVMLFLGFGASGNRVTV